VLVGDFLLSRGMLLALDNGDFELLKIVSEAVKAMSEGELLQIEKARRMDIEEPVYFDIITKKTASLIASCCAVGAASAGADKAAIDKMRQFGINVGIAFQIKDDIFDYQLNSQTGKPSGIDIKERKMTLPLIYLLNQSGLIEKRRIIHTVKRHGNNPEKVAGLIQKVQEAGGIAYAEQQMQHYVNLALEQLNGLPDSEALEALKHLVDYTVSRKK
jgi:octaprenyl-diphosphate synthase